MRFRLALFVAATVSVGIAQTAFSSEPPAEISGLIEDLKSGNVRQRMTAAIKLGNAGKDAESAIVHLEDALAKEKDARVKKWAREAVEKIRTAIANASGLDQPAVERSFPVAKTRGTTMKMADETAVMIIALDGEHSVVGVRTARDVILDGMLAVVFRKGYQPRIGTAHEIISSEKSIEGRFRYFDLPDLPADRAWRIHYDLLQDHDDLDGDGRTDVTLVVVPIADAWPAEEVDKARADAYQSFQRGFSLSAAQEAVQAGIYRRQSQPLREKAKNLRKQAGESQDQAQAFFLKKSAEQADREAEDFERSARSFEFYGREFGEFSQRLKQRLAAEKFPPLPALP